MDDKKKEEKRDRKTEYIVCCGFRPLCQLMSYYSLDIEEERQTLYYNAAKVAQEAGSDCFEIMKRRDGDPCPKMMIMQMSTTPVYGIDGSVPPARPPVDVDIGSAIGMLFDLLMSSLGKMPQFDIQFWSMPGRRCEICGRDDIESYWVIAPTKEQAEESTFGGLCDACIETLKQTSNVTGIKLVFPEHEENSDDDNS
jgi:hypothetical protein